MSTWEVLLKVQDVVNICSTELVDRLVVITNYAKILLATDKKANQLELSCIGILILVNHDVFEFVIIICTNIPIQTEKLYSLHDKIIEIKSIVLTKTSLILTINCGLT